MKIAYRARNAVLPFHDTLPWTPVPPGEGWQSAVGDHAPDHGSGRPPDALG